MGTAVHVIDVPGGCGAVLFAVSVTLETRAGTMANGIAPDASAASERLPALRVQTRIEYAPFAAVGVHANVFVGDQFCPIVQAVPSQTNHLYSYGATPPNAVAVNVVVVPAGCGATRLAASE